MKLTHKNTHGKYWLGAMVTLLLALVLAACSGTGSGTVSVTGSQGGGTSATPSHTATTGGGTTPTPTATTTPETTVPLTTIRMLDQENGWALTKSSILKTSNGGQTWHDVTPSGAQLNAQSTGDFMSGNYAWVATLQNSTATIWRTSNGGASWQSATFTTKQMALDRPHFINTQDGWIAAVTGQGMFHTDEEIYQTTNGGQSWTMVATTNNAASGLPAEGNKTGISFMNTTTGWATADIPADYSWLYKTTDGGKTWHNQPLSVPSGVTSTGEFITTPPVFFGTTGIMPVLLFTNNHNGIDLYVTHNGGQSWTPTQLTSINSQNVYVVDMQHAWATDTTNSNTTIVYATSNAGQSWQQVSTLAQPVGTLSFTNDQNGWAIGSSTTTPLLWHTSDGGHSWQSIQYSIVK